MHLSRPKSSKGRSRPGANDPLSLGDNASNLRTPGSPGSPVACRPDRNLRSHSQPNMWRQASQLSQEEVLQVLQLASAAPQHSLNKYKVLPSIGERQREVSPERRSLNTNMTTLSYSDDAIMQHRREELNDPTVKEARQTRSHEVDKRAGLWPSKPPDPGSALSREEAGALLLAIRAPCGRRFQQHFKPTDTLQTVKTSAELRYGAEYRHASFETMDVPRRSFTDMDVTLAQCGILNRSVLCISLK